MPRAKIIQETAKQENAKDKEEKPQVQESKAVQAAPEQAPKSEKKFQDQLEEWADGIVNSISYDRLKIWKNVFFHPTATLTEQMKYPGIIRGAKDVFMASIPSLLIGLIGLLIVIGYLALIGSFMALSLIILSPVLSILGIIGIIIGVVLLFALYIASPVISWFIYSAVQYIIAKILGGKADFKTHAYLTALTEAGNGWVVSLLAVFSLVPCVGWVLRPIAMLVSFYSIFLNFRAIKIAHDLDTPRAAAVVLVPIVISVVALIFLFLAFYLGIFSLAFLGPLIGVLATRQG